MYLKRHILSHFSQYCEYLIVVRLRKIAFIAMLFVAFNISAQDNLSPFSGYFYCEDLDVFLHIDMQGDGIEVPGHTMFGPLLGYMSKPSERFCWLITDASVVNQREVKLSMVNDYGSEDLTASIKLRADSSIVFCNIKGSQLKMANKGKWQKLPNEFVLKRKQIK